MAGDLDDRLAHLDLLGLIQKDVRLKLVARTDGGEWAGACPFCPDHGKDRFRVWPKHSSGRGRWWCRRCERSGDALDFLMQRDGLDFRSALDALGMGDCRVDSGSDGHQEPRTATSAEPDVEPPSQAWQGRARSFCEYAQAELWGADGQGARAYLHEVRGLSEETIRLFGLGYNPKCLYDKPVDKWDLQEGKAVYLSRGIVLPCEIDGQLWYVQIRRPYDAGENKTDTLLAYIGGDLPVWRPEAKYMAVKGSAGQALYGADQCQGRDHLMLVEGEFDLCLGWQELRDLVDVAALGGASKASQGLRGRWLLRTLYYSRILVVFDADQAGHRGAAGMAEYSKRVTSLTVPSGKDIVGFWQQGGDLRTWLLGELVRLGSS